MSEPNDDEVPVSQDEALDYLGPVSERLAASLIDGVLPGDRVGLAEKIRESLAGDEGAIALLAAAYDSGSNDAALGEIIATGRTGESDGKAVAPDWSDVGIEGLRRAIAREDNICTSCKLRSVCVVARTVPAELLVVVRRCLAYQA